MIDFLSRLAMSFSGFVATIVLTRTLGQTRYGAYVVVISVLAWVTIASNLGLEQAIKKRVSETTDGNYVVAGAIIQIGLYAIVAVCLWLAGPYLNAYMGIDATLILIGLLAARLIGDFVQTILDGQHLVHVSSLLSPIELTSRSIVQVSLVIAGFGITGAVAGYAIGAVVAALIGSYFVSFDPSLPSRQDFARLKSYAQFSWLSSVKGRTFLSMDTLVLALFVSNSLIAVYEIAWNLASLFAIFGSSISRTLFPEISKLSSEEGVSGEVVELLRVALTYAGLFIIPGLVGGALVGDIVLQIYGPGFDTGYYILLMLTFARLLYGYQSQFLTTLDAIDRPDLTFRINAVFVAANLVLNLALTWRFGWYGAAVATTLSAALGLTLSYYYASRVITVVIPFDEISKQAVAAGIMAAVVYALLALVGDSLALVLVFVGVGALVYFCALVVISHEFRTTVVDNLPLRVPTLVGS
ncbi:oligosaccharide flippase family protein [Natrinema altunense]|uniref:Polysaccharide biosynthesis protein n=1 Tax=Natrinema altunense (strain JCM 12890 / CGMCC 1.3731 / AJ2) TaxID=1227494 RepID=L9ZMU6_NATA2|nr:polysaccharide biosynthesis C-terminal domain-containing protein [Natrinema altunense]ELY86872.1 polysaccharide biosynthesis protein [Natrinema altunense JCM 12890]